MHFSFFAVDVARTIFVAFRGFSRAFFPPVSSSVLFDFNREFKQSTTAGPTTAAGTEKVWGEYASVVC